MADATANQRTMGRGMMAARLKHIRLATDVSVMEGPALPNPTCSRSQPWKVAQGVAGASGRVIQTCAGRPHTEQPHGTKIQRSATERGR